MSESNGTTRRRIDWSEEELEKVTDAAVLLWTMRPEITATELLTTSQNCLPADRRRPVNTGWAGFGRLLPAVKSRLAVMVNLHRSAALHTGGGDFVAKLNAIEAEGRQVRADAEARVKAAQDAEAATRSELDAVKTERDAARKLAADQAAQITDLMGRVRQTESPDPAQLVGRLFTMAGEWLADQKREILTEVKDELDKARYVAEVRLQQMHNLAAGRGGGPAPAPVLPASEQGGYMPLIVVAGLRRDDFQRAQQQVGHKQKVRLERLDVSKPNHLTIGKHDRLLVWANPASEIPVALVPTVAELSKHAVRCTGPLADLHVLIQSEANAVRAAVAAAAAKEKVGAA